MDYFDFKRFRINQSGASFKVGTDAILLGAWAALKGGEKVLDIGAGTGVISLILASRHGDLSVQAVEANEKNATLCKENFSNSPWSGQLRCTHAFIQELAGTSERQFDLIASNPPYFQTGKISENQDRAMARHASHLTYFQWLCAVDRLLLPSGSAAVVLPFEAYPEFVKIASLFRLYPYRVSDVRPFEDKPAFRCLIQLGRNKNPIHKNVITIRDVSGFSQMYLDLTGFLFPATNKKREI